MKFSTKAVLLLSNLFLVATSVSTKQHKNNRVLASAKEQKNMVIPKRSDIQRKMEEMKQKINMNVSEEIKADSTEVLGVEILTADKKDHATHSKVLLTFIHGAFTENDRYKPFLRTLQRVCLKKGIEADIGYGTYTNHIPNVARTSEILAELNKSSKYDAKFVFGHSAGALFAISAAIYDEIGSNFQSWFPGFAEPETVSLASYPKHVLLTVLGEVDGFMICVI